MKDKVYGRSRFYRFFRSNGVFIALAVSLLAIGGVLAAAFSGQWTTVEEEPIEAPVEQIVTNQPDERTITTVTTTGTTKTTEDTKNAGLYVLPLTNTVQKTYSVQEPQYSQTMADWRVHTGTDFAGKVEQSVKAIADGTVETIETDPLWGEVIVVDHGVGVLSKYCGVSASVKVGDEVEMCQVIGTLSEIPCESAQPPHLHLEILVDDQPVDPVAAINLDVRYAETTE